MIGFTSIGRVELDQIADVRAMHGFAFRRLTCDVFAEKEVDALSAYVESPAYTDGLVSAALSGAWIDDTLIGTFGWTAWTALPGTARICHVCVHPMFASAGLGSHLAGLAEKAARQGGYDAFCARVLAHAEPFFVNLGYEVTSHGVQHVSGDVSLPVTFLRKGARQLH